MRDDSRGSDRPFTSFMPPFRAPRLALACAMPPPLALAPFPTITGHHRDDITVPSHDFAAIIVHHPHVKQHHPVVAGKGHVLCPARQFNTMWCLRAEPRFLIPGELDTTVRRALTPRVRSDPRESHGSDVEGGGATQRVASTTVHVLCQAQQLTPRR